MKPSLLKRNLSLIYLTLIPFVAAILGFQVGYVSYKIYLPIWIINVCLMVTATWTLGVHEIRSGEDTKKRLAAGAFFLVVPWILVTMFAGLGPPPSTPAGWVETATEQQVRYFMLIIAGVFVAVGFAFLRETLRNVGENFYSLIGIVSMIIAIPLFIVNMIYWGSYLPELFRFMTTSGLDKVPEWFLPVRKQFGLLSVVEVALTYAATAAFALSLKRVGWFSKTASGVFVTISSLAFVIIVLSAFLPEPFVTAGFVVSIPASPFLLPYFIGVKLLRRTGG